MNRELEQQVLHPHVHRVSNGAYNTEGFWIEAEPKQEATMWDQIRIVGTEIDTTEGIYQLTGKIEAWIEDNRSILKQLFSKLDVEGDVCQTPTGKKIQKLRKQAQYGLFLWAAGENNDLQRRAEEMFDPQQGYLLRELGPQLAFVTGNELVKRPRDEEPFENSLFPYSLDYNSAVRNYRGNFMGTTGYQGAKGFIENELHLHEKWERLCRLVGRRKKFPSVPLRVSENEMAAIISRGKESTTPMPDGRFYLTNIESYNSNGLVLALDALQNFEPEYRDQLVLHEMGHLLTSKVPYNEWISEGLAWMHVHFYGKTHGQTWSQPSGTGVRTLYGSAGWLNPGEFAQTSEMGSGFHNGMGHIACETMLKYMGNTSRQRLHNFRNIVAVSQWKEGQGKCAYSLPSLSEWLYETGLRELSDMFSQDPFAQSLENGSRMFWCETGKTVEGRSNWGVLYAFDIQKNPNFRYTKPRPIHIQPKMEEFDMNPGSAPDLPIEIRVRLRSGKSYDIPETKGWAHVDPPFMLRTCPHEHIKELGLPFTLEVKLPDGTWQILGNNFWLTVNEVSFHLENLLRAHDQDKPDKKHDRNILEEIDTLYADKEASFLEQEDPSSAEIALPVPPSAVGPENPRDVIFKECDFPLEEGLHPDTDGIDAYFSDAYENGNE